MKIKRNYIQIILKRLILILFAFYPVIAWPGVPFNAVYAPQEGLVAPVEKPWRQEICLNGFWQFQPVALPEGYSLNNGAPVLPEPANDKWSETPIRIPSPWNVNSFGYGSGKIFPYPKEWESARMGWLRRQITVPEEWNGKRIILHFEAVLGHAQVVVNGHLLAEHFDNSLPFDVDITEFVKPGAGNELLVGVRHNALFDIPGKYGKITYPSGAPWTRQMIGIWQDVFLHALPPLRVDDIAIRPLVDESILELEVKVRNNSPEKQTFDIKGLVRQWMNEAGKDIISAAEPKWSLGNPVMEISSVTGTVGPKMTTTLTIRVPVKGELNYWTMDTPNLYGLILDVSQGTETRDRFYERFGWRQWGISGRDVTLNGKPITLLGDAGHFLGVQYQTRRFAWSWYHALKMANGNAIRLHACIRPRFYMELADEMGIAILSETEIYNSTMDINYYAPETWLRFGAHVDALVLRDRNYPSVFGWSIANEVLSALWWKGVPRDYWQPIIEKSADLADRIKILDPTRPWISSDGDGDFHGRLPTYIYHYGNPHSWERNAPKDKPFGIGEGGSMLWGSPVVFSAYNGERSYESNEGMMDGIAREIYHYLVVQRNMSAYTSIFTFEGSGFHSLPLGLNDKSRIPDDNDGIFFGPFKEGQPGIQPDRILPYSTKFNPGYDPNLPFIMPTASFEAIKAAYAPGKPAPCEWDHFISSPELPAVPKPTIPSVGLIGKPDGQLGKALVTSGIKTNRKSNPGMLVIDGATLSTEAIASAKAQMKAVLEGKGKVFIWVSDQNTELVNKLLPAPVSITRQNASALLANRKAPETAAIALADLYFQDQSDRNIVKNVISGKITDTDHTLIETAEVRARRGTGITTGKFPVLIAAEYGGGTVYVTSLIPDVTTKRRLEMLRKIFANMGVALSKPSTEYLNGFDGMGFVNEALVIGSFQGAPYPENIDVDYLGGESKVIPGPGTKVTNRTWQLKSNPGDGIFDFYNLKLPGTEGSHGNTLAGGTLRPEALDNNGYLESSERLTLTAPGVYSVAYLSFWVYSPVETVKENTNIFLHATSDDGKKIWVNHENIIEDRLICGPGTTNSQKLPLALKKGWNHFMVKIGQQDGPWSFSARFECTDPQIAALIKTVPVITK